MLRLLMPARTSATVSSAQRSYFVTQPSRDMKKTKRPSGVNFGPPCRATRVLKRAMASKLSPSRMVAWWSPVSTTTKRLSGSAAKAGAATGG